MAHRAWSRATPRKIVPAKYADSFGDITVSSKMQGSLRDMLEELVIKSGAANLMVLQWLPENNKLEFVLDRNEIINTIVEVMSKMQPNHRLKCARASLVKRQECFAAMSVGEYDKALALATEAVFWAPMKEDQNKGKVSLAWSLWMRAEVLMNCKRYAAAIEDLNLAYKEGMPKKLHGVYYWQLGDCYKAVGDLYRAKISYEIAMILRGKNEEVKGQLEINIASLDDCLPFIPPLKKPVIKLTGGENKSMPALSNLVKITEQENKGRFAVADSAIKTGDVLLVDTPYAACLKSAYYRTHCQNCFIRFEDFLELAPVPCVTCSRVAYCSIGCRDTANSTFHHHECQYIHLFTESGLSLLCHIALRMVTQVGLNTSLSIHQKYIANDNDKIDAKNVVKETKKQTREQSKGTKKSMVGSDKKLLAKEFAVPSADRKSSNDELGVKVAQVYSLSIHSEHRPGSDILKKFTIALLLCRYLEKTGFFDSCKNKDDKETATRAIIELIVRNIQILQFNAHEISETLHLKDTCTSKTLTIGGGIYPTGALLNHDCYPAVTRYFEGRNMVLTAVRPLSPGEEVSISYGPHFMEHDRNERQRLLASRYLFNCQCKACEEDWPTLKQQMQHKCIYLKCQNSSCRAEYSARLQRNGGYPTKCEKCESRLHHNRAITATGNVNKCLEQYGVGAHVMEEDKIRNAIVAMGAAIDQFHTLAHPPHMETHVTQEALSSCIAMQGNVHQMKQSPAKVKRRTSI